MSKKIQKPGEKPTRSGEFIERGPRGGEVTSPRVVTIESSDSPLPPTQKPGHTWERIGPPKDYMTSETELEGRSLEYLSNEELIQIAYERTTDKEAARLRTLLEAQHERSLTIAERSEATYLVEQEDLLTLKKARAIYLLKQRHALPDELAAILSK